MKTDIEALYAVINNINKSHDKKLLDSDTETEVEFLSDEFDEWRQAIALLKKSDVFNPNEDSNFVEGIAFFNSSILNIIEELQQLHATMIELNGNLLKEEE